VKELLKSVHICQSYRKNKSGTFFNGPRCSSPVVYERPARSVPGFALITAPVLTFLFTGRDAAITMNSIKIDITQ